MLITVITLVITVITVITMITVITVINHDKQSAHGIIHTNTSTSLELTTTDTRKPLGEFKRNKWSEPSKKSHWGCFFVPISVNACC